MVNLVRKPVVFNLDDPFQRQLLIHTNKYPNFSGYIKRLLQRDMEGGLIAAPIIPFIPHQQDEDFKAEGWI